MDTFKYLRLNQEPCQVFGEQKIHQMLMDHTIEFMDMLERFYMAWQRNARMVQQPKKEVFATEGLKGDWRSMPCMIASFEGHIIKAIKVIGTNEEEKVVKDKICVGKALLIHETDNYAQAIFDVCALSSFRTAALSVLAYKHSDDRERGCIGLIGTGRIGYYTAIILNQWMGIESLNVYDIKKTKMDTFCAMLEQRIAVNTTTLSKMCKNNTAVFLSTTSTKPILTATNVGAVQFISSVGADAHNLSEIDGSLLKDFTLVSESRQNIDFGDMFRWKQAGDLKKSQITELRTLINRKIKNRTKVLFISTGTAVQDALLCHFLFQNKS